MPAPANGTRIVTWQLLALVGATVLAVAGATWTGRSYVDDRVTAHAAPARHPAAAEVAEVRADLRAVQGALAHLTTDVAVIRAWVDDERAARRVP